MKVSNNLVSYSNTKHFQGPVQNRDKAKNIIATGIGVSIRKKHEPQSVVKNNNPDDPSVAKKTLDALSLGLINFNQRERDAIAVILGEKAINRSAAKEQA